MERLESEYVAETNGHCFFCLRSGGGRRCSSRKGKKSNGGVGSLPLKLEQGSFKAICRYLQMDMNQLFGTLKQPFSRNMNRVELKGNFCEGCLKLTKEFTELNLEMEKIQMKIHEVLGQVEGRLVEGNRNHLDGLREKMTSLPWLSILYGFVETLRQESLVKCAKVLRKEQLPRVIVKKTKTSISSSDVRNDEPQPLSIPGTSGQVANEPEAHPQEPIAGSSGTTAAPAPAARSCAAVVEAGSQTEAEGQQGEEERPAVAVITLDDQDEVVEPSSSTSQAQQSVAAAVTSRNKKNPTKFRCGRCDRRFRQITLLKKHEIREHSDSHKCLNCPGAFSSERGLLLHTLSLHKRRQSSSSPPVAVSAGHVPANNNQPQPPPSSVGATNERTCGTCKFTFSSRRYVRQHQAAKHLGIRFQCDSCEKTFSFETTLSHHRRKTHNLWARAPRNLPGQEVEGEAPIAGTSSGVSCPWVQPMVTEESSSQISTEPPRLSLAFEGPRLQQGDHSSQMSAPARSSPQMPRLTRCPSQRLRNRP